MPIKYVPVRSIHAIDTLENWELNTTVLLSGELAIATHVYDDNPLLMRMKIGDGVNSFANLPWFNDISKLNKSMLGAANGIANLDNNGKIPYKQIPREIYDSSDVTINEPVLVPEIVGIYIYNGEIITPTWKNFDNTKLTATGSTSGTNAGRYTITFTPKRGYCWDDDTVASRDIEWDILRSTTTVPSTSSKLTYNGATQSPVWDGYDSNKMAIGGMTSGVNANSYVATFIPKNNYKWSDNTIDAKYVSWTIGPAKVNLMPTQKGTITFDATEKLPEWDNYNSEQLNIQVTPAIEAGEYTAFFTPKSNYTWSDNTVSQRSATWRIMKTEGTLTLSKTKLYFPYLNMIQSIDVNTNVQVPVLAKSDDSSIATPSVVANTVNITSHKVGSCVITVSLGSTSTNYILPLPATCDIEIKTISSMSLTQVKEFINTGSAMGTLAVGDSISTPLNGTCFNFTADNLQTASQVLGFNHNKNVETPDCNSSVSFILGKLDTKDIALCESTYNTTYLTSGFIMNPKGNTKYASSSTMYTNGYNEGGWEASYMRNTALPSLLENCFPEDASNVFYDSVIKYTDNVGNATHVIGNVTATTEKLFLMSEWEFLGTRYYANQYEQNYQTQYQYYKNGNSKYKYRHDSTATSIYTWLRSVYYNQAYAFVDSINGSYNTAYPAFSLGICPVFVIIEE